MKNKFRIVIAALLIIVLACAGCGSKEQKLVSGENTAEEGTSQEKVTEGKTDESTSTDASVNVITTTFAAYDWAKNVVGDNSSVNVSLLMDSAVDMHSYEPTANDIVKLNEADLIIAIGGESEEWLEDIDNENIVTLIDCVNAVPEELVEGMEGEEEEGHSHEKKEVTEDRPLSDFEGEWQSVYPFMNDKFRDETVSYMAEAEGFDVLDEAWDFFYVGNETDVRYINIKGDKVEFIKENGDKTEGTYEYDGFYSDCWGETSIRYQYVNTDSNSKAPKYIQFDDHLNYATKTEHFHIYCGDDGKAMLDIMYNWPTYYPSDITDEDEMIHEFLKHYITEDEEEEEEEYDEHIWLSLRNASACVDKISEEIGKISAGSAATCKDNAEKYKEELKELDEQYIDVVGKGDKDTILFGDRFPFRYMVEDYGLNYYAAFIGCSAETEASFETIVFLAGKVNELKLNTVCVTSDNNKIAETVISSSDNKDAKIVRFNDMHSITNKECDNYSYIQIMKDNLVSLEETLK